METQVAKHSKEFLGHSKPTVWDGDASPCIESMSSTKTCSKPTGWDGDDHLSLTHKRKYLSFLFRAHCVGWRLSWQHLLSRFSMSSKPTVWDGDYITLSTVSGLTIAMSLAHWVGWRRGALWTLLP